MARRRDFCAARSSRAPKPPSKIPAES